MIRKSVLTRIYSIAVIGIIGFSIYWSYSLFTTLNNNERLTKIETVYFPVLERMDAIIVRTDRIKELFTQAVLAGEEEPLETAESEFKKNINNLEEIGNLHPTSLQESIVLKESLTDYFNKAMVAARGMIDETLVETELENTIQTMNTAFELYKNQQKDFRSVAYQNFTETIKTANKSSQLAIQVGTGLGLFSFLLLIVFCILIARSIMKPIKAMTHFIDQFKVGVFDVRLNLDQQDELGQIAASLDEFAETLEVAINEINQVMGSISRGDFTENVTGNHQGRLDDLKQNINSSIKLLSHAIYRAVTASEEVKSGASELTNSSQSLSDGTTTQAASLQEIASSMDELKHKTKGNSDNSSAAQNLTGETLDVVLIGNKQMEEMQIAMKNINETSSKVSKVIKAIDEIAFQTNLLALNAAVEAARAGKYGKGFAVVAEEVRALAERSAQAAKETTSLITNSIKEVEVGVKSTDETAEVLESITSSVEKVNAFVSEIAVASREQTDGISDINRELDQVSRVIQQSSAIAEETASTSELLSQQSNQLKILMDRFRLNKANAREQAPSPTKRLIPPFPN